MTAPVNAPANNITSNVTVLSGTLSVAGNAVLASTGAAAITVDTGGVLQLDDSQNNPNNNVVHLTGAAPTVVLNGGTLSLLGSTTAGTAVAQTITAVSLASGNSTITATQGSGASTTLTIATLTRGAAGATVYVNVGNNGASLGSTVNITVSPAPTLTPAGAQPNTTGILPYATVTTGASTVELATYSGTSIQKYSAVGTAYVASVNSQNGTNSTKDVNDTGASDSIAASTTVNSITFSGGGTATLTIPTGVTLTVTSGALLTTNNTALTVTGGGTLLLTAATDGVIITTGGASTNFVDALNPGTAAAMTLSGTGTVTLPTANTYTGGTFVNGSTVIVGNDTSLGASSGTVTFISGALQTSLPGGLILSNPLTLNNSTVTFSGSNMIDVTGAITLNGSLNTLNVNVFTTFAGAIPVATSGTGAMLINAGTSELSLTAANTAYTGLITVNSGILNVQIIAALGAITGGTIVNSGATLQLQNAGTFTLVEPIALSGNGAGNTVNGLTDFGALQSVSGANEF